MPCQSIKLGIAEKDDFSLQRYSYSYWGNWKRKAGYYEAMDKKSCVEVNPVPGSLLRQFSQLVKRRWIEREATFYKSV